MSVRPTNVRLLVLVALTSVFVLPGAASAETPPAAGITLDVVSVNGSGCPPGTANVSVLPDSSGFRVTYRDFLARAGGETNPTDFRKNCQLNVLVHIPQGFTFAVAQADYRGRARLENGATALERTNYYFQGSPDNNYVDHNFSGPLSGTWHTIDATPVNELVYAPCGEDRNLNVNTEIRVDEGTVNPNKVSSMSMRTSEGNVDTIVHFEWKQC
ncbi:DUF4360 domain-containing protein [Actinophytocola oryzae]|uniref:Uncharacterized protein DUF4360 n=1 Tax=Actinophytocola oryzae TaxID=502181 RepID=A0A4V3FUD7_9PSEU|nr:DUF4360 domain-containing protein [Actinophytocola oryzae]TDV54831.1 uncharacterized protein DUF4360 [Actinophytocola oryzae]